MYSSMPAANPSWWFSAVALADVATTKFRPSISPDRSIRRISLVASKPSITGICTSISTTSYLAPARSMSTASLPLFARSDVMPQCFTTTLATFWFIRLSSTTSTFPPWRNNGSSIAVAYE